jgi:hypothetical protein
MSHSFDDFRHEELRRLAIKRCVDPTPTEDLVLGRASSSDDGDAKESNDRPTIRADLVRWLVSDSSAWQYIDPLGVRLANVTLEEPLNLNSCQPQFPIKFEYCTFNVAFSLGRVNTISI